MMMSHTDSTDFTESTSLTLVLSTSSSVNTPKAHTSDSDVCSVRFVRSV